MKVSDAIKNVIRPEGDPLWGYTAPLDEIASVFGFSAYDFPDEDNTIDRRLKAYPIWEWLCTDTHVGLYAIYLDDIPVGCSWQSARKNDIEISWLSEEAVERTRRFLMDQLDKTVPTFQFVGDAEITDDFSTVGYTSQLLTDDGFFEGRPVRVLIRYSNCRSTPAEYIQPGRSYYAAAAYGAENHNCLLVQDGDEQRLIPVDQFMIPLNVKVLDE